jgi:hypothetical protein
LELEEQHLQNMILALPTNPDGWTNMIDLQPLNFRLTIDSASEFLFGESVNSQLAALPGYGDDAPNSRFEDAAFVTAFERSQDIIAKAFRFNDWYSIGLTKEYYETCKICHRYIDRFVQKGLSHEKQMCSRDCARLLSTTLGHTKPRRTLPFLTSRPAPISSGV